MFAPEGQLIASAGRDGLFLWDPTSGALCGMMNKADAKHLDGRCDIAILISPDSRLVAYCRSSSASLQGMIQLYDTKLMKEHGVIECRKATVALISLALDGGVLATAAFDRTVKLWDAMSLTLHSEINVKHTARCLTFSLNDTVLAYASGYKVIV